MSLFRVGGTGNAARRLRWHDLRDVAHAQLALLRALARVRTRPVGRLVSRAAGPLMPDGASVADITRRPRPPAELDARRASVQRLELAIARAARRGLFRPTCLVRSLALADLLTSHGVPGAEIRVGVRHPGASAAPMSAAGTRLEAHAWVELDGLVLDEDTRRTHSFTPLGGVRVVHSSAEGGH